MTTNKKADIMLHPVRMRIIQHLITYERLTTAELLEKMEDVPQATMYRQISTLVKADLITVVDTEKRRGTIEKTYALTKENLKVTDEEIASTSKEQHLKYFMTYQANLLKETEQFVLNHDPATYKEHGFGYWQASLHFTDEEFQAFAEDLRQLFEKASQHKPAKERTSRTIASILIPRGK